MRINYISISAIGSGLASQVPTQSACEGDAKVTGLLLLLLLPCGLEPGLWPKYCQELLLTGI